MESQNDQLSEDTLSFEYLCKVILSNLDTTSTRPSENLGFFEQLSKGIIPAVVTIDEALANENLLDIYLDQHSGCLPYASYGPLDYLNLSPAVTIPRELVLQHFLEEKGRRRKEKIMAICSILKQVYERKVKEE